MNSLTLSLKKWIFFLVKVREIYLMSCRNVLHAAFVIILCFNDLLVH